MLVQHETRSARTEKTQSSWTSFVIFPSADFKKNKNVPQATRVLSESTKIIGIVWIVFENYFTKNLKFSSLDAKKVKFSCAWKIFFPSTDFKKNKNVPQATRVLSESSKIIGIVWVVAEIFETEKRVFFFTKKTVLLIIAWTPLNKGGLSYKGGLS